MGYRYFVLDADETLLDFPAAQEHAIYAALLQEGHPADPETAQRFDQINKRLWRLRERGEITQDQLILRRFEELLEGRPGAQALAAAFLEQLSLRGDLIPGALEAVRGLKESGAKVAIATNGVGKTQRGRLAISGLMELLDGLAISQEVGAVKPDPRLIEAALTAMGCTDKAQALMVGDSAASDILAAQRAGIDACWYNPSGAAYTGETKPTYEISDIKEILRFV